MMQMKYRYDIEIDRAKRYYVKLVGVVTIFYRSALHKIYEGDDTPTRLMILCVSDIIQQENEERVCPLCNLWIHDAQLCVHFISLDTLFIRANGWMVFYSSYVGHASFYICGAWSYLYWIQTHDMGS